MTAALQMYDWPEIQGRLDAFWSVVRAALPAHLGPPAHLSRPDDLSAPWRDPGLVLGQTCGLPYVSGRAPGARLIGRPVFGVDGTGEGTYSSAIVVRRGAASSLSGMRGARAAANEPGSQSGYNALLDAVMDAGEGPFFGKLLWSGAHRNSAAMVADGVADIAAIDAVAWALFAELEPERHAKLEVLAWTRPMPAVPFITAARNADAVPDLLAALNAGARAVSGTGVPTVVLSATDADYEPIRAMAARVEGHDLAPASCAPGRV